MTEMFTIEGLVSQFMRGADDNYRQKIKMHGVGFVVGPRPLNAAEPAEEQMQNRCNLMQAAIPIDTLESLRRFAGSVRMAVKMSDGFVAGVLCELSIKLDDAPPCDNVVLYIDQKYGGMRVYVAPKIGEHLVFRDLGVAHPAANFLPTLIPTEAYGPTVVEA
jgi:hypothetical protein